MRLIEEKELLILQIINLILILVSTVFIQICDTNINNYNQQIIEKQGNLNNLLQLQSEYRSISEYYNLILFISSIKDTELEINYDNDIFSSQWVAKDFKKIASKVNDDSLSTKDHLKKMYNEYCDLYQSNYEKYNKQVISYSIFIQNQPFWFNFKRILIILQFIFIALLAFGYCKLIIKISKRANA